MKNLDLSGIWSCRIPGCETELRLPGTLDEQGVGFADDPLRQWKLENVREIGFWHEGDPIVTRLTRKHTYEGEARVSRVIDWRPPAGKRVFLECERARRLRLLVNGREAPTVYPATISTPYVFEITGLASGHDEFVFLSDNSYPGWPAADIIHSSAATDETQTNWNGLLGRLRLYAEEPAFIAGVRAYPRRDALDLCVEIDAARAWEGALRIGSDAIARPVQQRASVPAGLHAVWIRDIPLRPDAPRWDLEEGNLCALTVSADGLNEKTIRFGLRTFRAENGCLTLNGRRVFLRAEANCAVFPETGYCPMDAASWKAILQKYRAYGVNCMRFHSHCPPEAAFAAADEMGMLMQPELSHWNPKAAFSTEESRRYYREELLGILRVLANHPSFVMLTFGNELRTDDAGHAYMDELLKTARDYDGTRLYANGSNVHYGAIGCDAASDFYTAMVWRGQPLRAASDGAQGWLNQEYPDARHDYDAVMADIRRESDQPVFSFEVGQYEVLPDFDEIRAFRGVTRPDNLTHIQKRALAAMTEREWKRRVEATGELSLLCYRAEAEAALRTAGYSGISLLGLQDFPGQGTALIGMMNAHLQPKPYDFARPERFSAFFRDALPLALLPRFTYTAGETARVPVRFANYGKKELRGELRWTLSGEKGTLRGAIPDVSAPVGGLCDAGELSLTLSCADRAEKLTLELSFCGIINRYPLWVYPDCRPVCPESVYECRAFDENALRALEAGGRVYLAPDATAEALPRSIKTQFSPDFWSVCTFPHQAGGMGQLIDSGHPLFRAFPTEAHIDWQWWPMASQRAVILPEPVRAIVTEMDSYAFLRPMAKLFECRCLNGRLLFSSMGLHDLQRYPEARALQQAVYDYMASDLFRPEQTLSPDWLRQLTDRGKP